MPPPSCANSATNDAPNPYPMMRNGISRGTTAVVSRTSVYSPLTPSRDMATTSKPDTAPPRSASCTPSCTERVVPAAVRMLARMEIHMPM